MPDKNKIRIRMTMPKTKLGSKTTTKKYTALQSAELLLFNPNYIGW